jgi:hypothetical protein
MEVYKKPTMEVIEMDKVDVLTSSCECTCPCCNGNKGISAAAAGIHYEGDGCIDECIHH